MSKNLELFTVFVSIKDWKLTASWNSSADVDVETDIVRQPSENKEKEFNSKNDTQLKT